MRKHLHPDFSFLRIYTFTSKDGTDEKSLFLYGFFLLSRSLMSKSDSDFDENDGNTLSLTNDDRVELALDLDSAVITFEDVHRLLRVGVGQYQVVFV